MLFLIMYDRIFVDYDTLTLCMLISTEISIGFTVSEQSVGEADGMVALEVLVVSGILQRSVNIVYETVEMTSGKAATSEFL